MRKREAGPNAIGKTARYSDEEIADALSLVPKMRQRARHIHIDSHKVEPGGPTLFAIKRRARADAALEKRLTDELAKRKHHASIEFSVNLAKRRVAPVRALCQNEIYEAANAALALGLDAHVRDDVISDIIVAVLEGELRAADIPSKARQFVNRYYQRFSPHAFPRCVHV